MLRSKYPGTHAVRSDGALFDYTLALKNRFLRNAELARQGAFRQPPAAHRQRPGQQWQAGRVMQGGNRIKCESTRFSVASVFKDAPPEFLKMIVVHELAHLEGTSEHDRAFYQLCSHMEPAYHQLEFDLRLYLTQRELSWLARRIA
jgi:predicted SprT family Zn-dependent metalloprotease